MHNNYYKGLCEGFRILGSFRDSGDDDIENTGEDVSEDNGDGNSEESGDAEGGDSGVAVRTV